MKLNTNGFLYCLLFTAILVSCAKQPHTNAEIQAAMNNYDSLILKQNAAAIAQAFTPDGKLGDAAAGRAAIETLISQITAFKVIEQSSTTTDIQIRGDSALQKGTYVQRDVNAKNDTINAMGTFTCKWKWLDGEGWKIDHIITHPF